MRLTHSLQGAFFALLCLAVLTFGTAGQGQDAAGTTDILNVLSDRAEATVQASDVPDSRLEQIRSELAIARADTRAAIEDARARVAGLESQIEALGPPPEEGQSEPTEISFQRTQLTESLEEARVPVVAAEAEIARAADLLNRIDAELRRRFSETLTRRGPVPILPQTIATAITDIQVYIQDSVVLTRERLEQSQTRLRLAERWPVALVLAIVALIGLFVVRRRITRSVRESLNAADTRAGRALWSVALNLSLTVVPAAAGFLLVLALRDLNPGSAVSNAVVTALPSMVGVLIAARWIGNSLFLKPRDALAVIPTSQSLRTNGRRLTFLLAIVLALVILIEFLVSGSRLSEPAAAVLNAPLIVLGGIILFPLSRLLRMSAESAEPPEQESETSLGSLDLVFVVLSRAGMTVAIIAPLVALAGYQNAARYLFVAFCYSYGLIGGLLIIFWLLREMIESWLEGGQTKAEEDFRAQFRLLPVLFGMALALAALPVLAIVWGARRSDVSNVVTWMREGVTIGETQLSASDFLVFAVIFAIGYIATRAIQSVFRNSVLPRTSADIGARTAIVSGIGYVGIFLAALAAISATGLSLSNLAIVAGALSIGVGFGLQTIVSNFVSGIILLVERPIKQGDWIEVSGFSGYVRRISVRATEIETFDRASVIVPNADLIANPVLNWTHSNLQARVIVPIGVAYGTDVRRVEAILTEIARDHQMVLAYPSPSVVFQGFGADALNFEIRAIVRDANHVLSVRSDLNYGIAERFAAEKIEIPFAQRDITLRNATEILEAWRGSQKEGEP